MPEGRKLIDLLIDIESVGDQLESLASSVVLIGGAARTNGVERSNGGGIEILGEVIGERVAHLHRLILEACANIGMATEAGHG